MDATARRRDGGVFGPAGRHCATRAVARQRREREISIGRSGAPLRDTMVRDASTHGCRIDCVEGWLRVGAFVSLRTGDAFGHLDQAVAPVMGIVRWVRGGSAGIEFLQPLQVGSPAWRHLLDDRD